MSLLLHPDDMLQHALQSGLDITDHSLAALYGWTKQFCRSQLVPYLTACFL